MTHTTPLKDSDDSIFRHFLRQRTLVFGFLLGIIVGRATLHFLPAIQVGEPKRLETLSTKNAQEVREQSQSESVVRVPAASVARVQAEKPGLLEDRANHLMYPVNTLEVDVLRTMGLCTLIAEWARRDFNGVIRWLRSTDIGDRKSLYVGMALLGLSESDPTRAFETGIQMYRDDGQDPVDSEVLLNICLRKFPERMEEVLDLPMRAKYTHRIDTEFGSTTDFQKIGDLVLRNYRESGKEAWEPPVFPRNFIEEWTKRDPQAAFDFCIAQNGIKRKTVTDDAVENFAKTYASVAAPADAVNLLQYLMTTDEVRVNRQQITKHFNRASEAQYGIFKSALVSVPPEYRDAIGANTLDDYSYSSDRAATTARRRALEIMAMPKARLAAASEFIHEYPVFAEEVCDQLRAMGHTEQDIEALHFKP